MARKRDKIKKVFSPPPAEPAPQDGGDTLEDDLFAQLDAKDAEVRKEAAVVLQSVESAKSEESVEKSRKDSRSRFEARAVSRILIPQAPLYIITHYRQGKLSSAPLKWHRWTRPLMPECSERLKRRRLLYLVNAMPKVYTWSRYVSHRCNALCRLTFRQIPPDGHCLYTAVADQLALLGLIPPAAAVPITTRTAAATYMYAHPDAFIPFLPSIDGEDGEGAGSAGLMTPKQFEIYCSRVRDTGTWGGEPEIMALASAYKVPIHVVQSGPQRVVVHAPTDGVLAKPDAVVKISYHRRMYGLGEVCTAIICVSYVTNWVLPSIIIR